MGIKQKIRLGFFALGLLLFFSGLMSYFELNKLSHSTRDMLDASLKNMDYIWYASPNAEALETYPAYYEETYGEPLDPALYEIMAPSQEVLDRCEAYLVLPAETRTLYNDLWTQLGI